jgi:hypothetical protein
MLIRWINAKSLAEQFQVGLLWVALMVIFEVSRSHHRRKQQQFRNIGSVYWRLARWQ